MVCLGLLLTFFVGRFAARWRSLGLHELRSRAASSGDEGAAGSRPPAV
jgi:hypothetical protein